jgi:hypothetical protein
MAKTGLQNEALISELLVSGSTAISKNEFGVYSFEQTALNDGVISGKLIKPKYNETELVKSVDTVIFELLPPVAPPVDDRVPRPIYNVVTQSVIDLTQQVVELTDLVYTLRAKVQDVEIVSESLRVDLDLQNLNVAASQNQVSQITTKITSTITELQNSIQKGTSEAIQRVSLFARNQALEQELSQLRVAISAKEQSLAAGAVSTGQLSSILFDKGDPTKEDTPQMIGMDYNGAGASANAFGPPGNAFAKTFRTYFEVIASSELTGNKEVTVDVKFTGAMTQPVWDFGFPLPIKIKAGETRRFNLKTPTPSFKGLRGKHKRKPTEYIFTFSVIVTDGTKTENKDYTVRIYKY